MVARSFIYQGGLLRIRKSIPKTEAAYILAIYHGHEIKVDF